MPPTNTQSHRAVSTCLRWFCAFFARRLVRSPSLPLSRCPDLRRAVYARWGDRRVGKTFSLRPFKLVLGLSRRARAGPRAHLLSRESRVARRDRALHDDERGWRARDG